jgi:hypothetical protein
MSDEAGLHARLTAALATLAAGSTTTTYGALAADLAIPGPGSIAALTSALEALMEDDTRLGQPLRAALLHARGSMLPAPGFFAKAAALGHDTTDPTAFTARHRDALFSQD